MHSTSDNMALPTHSTSDNMALPTNSMSDNMALPMHSPSDNMLLHMHSNMLTWHSPHIPRMLTWHSPCIPHLLTWRSPYTPCWRCRAWRAFSDSACTSCWVVCGPPPRGHTPALHATCLPCVPLPPFEPLRSTWPTGTLPGGFSMKYAADTPAWHVKGWP